MPERSSILQISKVGKTFGTRSGSFEALRDVDLAISGGEFVSIIGHSGCGKSTLLNLVAGLETPTLGGIFLEGQLVDGPGPERAVVFQNHSLLPWLTVYGNVRLAFLLYSFDPADRMPCVYLGVPPTVLKKHL